MAIVIIMLTNVQYISVARGISVIAAIILACLSPTAVGQQILGLDDALIQTLVPADANCCRLIPGDQMWVVSTRQADNDCECVESNPIAVQIMQFDGCRWHVATWEALQAECENNPHLATMIYVHGNFSDFGWSLRRGCQVYDNLLGTGCARGRRLCAPSRCCNPVCRDEPVRMIIWSWQSEREALPPCDFWIKSARACREGVRFNSVLRELTLHRPVIVGYSLGVQVILSSLMADESAADRSPWRVALLAPVLDCSFPDCLCTAQAMDQRIESLVLFTNCRDRALKTANRAIRLRTRSTPFDQYDLATSLASLTRDFRQYEISRESGGKHAIVHYTEQATVQIIVRELFHQAAGQ